MSRCGGESGRQGRPWGGLGKGERGGQGHGESGMRKEGREGGDIGVREEDEGGQVRYG